MIIGTSFGGDENLIETVKKRYNNNKKLYAQFDLKVYWGIREKTENKEGILYLGDEDRFNLTLGSTQWVCDGATFWQYNTKTSQVIIKDLLDVNLSMHPSSVITRFLSYNFKYEGTKKKEAHFVCTNIAEKSKGTYTSLEIWINKKDNTVSVIKFVDRSENESTYTFKKTDFDTDIKEEQFTFTVPEGADVVDTRS